MAGARALWFQAPHTIRRAPCSALPSGRPTSTPYRAQGRASSVHPRPAPGLQPRILASRRLAASQRDDDDEAAKGDGERSNASRKENHDDDEDATDKDDGGPVQKLRERLLDAVTIRERGDIVDTTLVSLAIAVYVWMSMQLYRVFAMMVEMNRDPFH